MLVRLQHLKHRPSKGLCRSAEVFVQPQNHRRRRFDVLVQPQILKRSHERDHGWTEDMESLNNLAKKAVLNNLLKASAQRQVNQALQEPNRHR